MPFPPKPPHRRALKIALLDDGRELRQIAAAAGICAHTLGRISNGYIRDPLPATRAGIAATLGVDESLIFPEYYENHDELESDPFDAVAAEIIESMAQPQT